MKKSLRIPLLLFATLLYLAPGCGNGADDLGSIEFSWLLGDSYLPCVDWITNVDVLLTDMENREIFKESFPCDAGEAVIRNLELDSYQLLIQGRCEGPNIGYRFESLAVVSRSGKTDLGIITLEKVSTVCDSMGCGPGQRPILVLSTDPESATAEPNGSDAITATATGLDDTCQSLSPGTQIEFFLSNQSPEEVGFFPNRSASITESYGPTGVTTEIRSLVGGTARLWAYCAEYDIISAPQKITFLPFTEQHPGIHLQASSSEVLADNLSTVDLTAEVLTAGGVHTGGGEEVLFHTELGRFQESGLPTLAAFTDDSGTAQATLVGGIQGGTAVVSASAFIDDMDISDRVEIKVRQLGMLEFVSAIPDRLGTKDSGRNESSEITFVVRDTLGTPFPTGTLVEFTHSGSPDLATLDPVDARTDHQGEVHTTLVSGYAPASLTVTAVARMGGDTLQATSPIISIVGAKPNARYITFSCERDNVGGLVLDFVETSCTVSLGDRYSNKIGLATNVQFLTEAGSIDGSALTEERGVSIGTATVTTRTGNPRPKDVSPISGEPYIGPRNPRDGLVTIIAITAGEEDFQDVNGNGEYDSGEPFTDAGEPFLDEDDDGVRDPDEMFRDTNNNYSYDGPNGAWDSDTLIWDVTYMLWTGEMASANPGDCGAQYRYSIVCPNTFFIPKGDETAFDWEVKDVNLNPLNESAIVDVAVEGKGSLGQSTPQLPHGVHDLLQGDWDNGGGTHGWVTVRGAPVSDPNPSESGRVNLDVNWRQSPGAGATRQDTISVPGVFQ